MEVVIYTDPRDGDMFEVKDKICSVFKPVSILFKGTNTFEESEESKQPYVLWKGEQNENI